MRLRHVNPYKRALARLMLDIEKLDATKDYEKRNTLVYSALALASANGFQCGIYIDKSLHDAERWPIVQIELPQGQVSWHVPASETPWDGHSTPEKYERIHRFARQLGWKVD